MSEVDEWLDTNEVEVIDSPQTVHNMVGTEIIHNPDELEKRQVTDLLELSGNIELNHDPKVSDSELNEGKSVDEHIDWDKSRSLLRSLENLADKLKKINEVTDENELLTGYLSDDGESTKPGVSDHTYCSTPATGVSKEGLAIGSDKTTGPLNNQQSDKDFARENNAMLHLVMDTLLTVNKNLKRNNEKISSYDGRMIELEGRMNANIAVVKTQVLEQESAYLELIDRFQKDKDEITERLEGKVEDLKTNKVIPGLHSLEMKLEHKIVEHRAELEEMIISQVCRSIDSEVANMKINTVVTSKIKDLSLAKKRDVIALKKKVEELDTSAKAQISEGIEQKLKSLPPTNKNEMEKISKRIKDLESDLVGCVNTVITENAGALPFALKSECVSLASVSKFHTEKLGETADTMLKFDAKQKKIEEREAKNTCRVKSCEEKISNLEKEIAELQQKTLSLKEMYEAKLREIDDLLKSKFSPSSDTISNPNEFRNPSLEKKLDDYCKKTDRCYAKIDKINFKVENSTRYSQAIDARTRKNNVIIDQLFENDNENTFVLVNQILDHTLSDNDRANVVVGRAYRLGIKPRDNRSHFTRKIFVEFSTPRSKDIVMENARKITKSGNNGRPYYITDDIPDAIKRKKADLHKYYNYLKQKGREVEKIGDDMVIDGYRWNYCDLNKLPPGDRIMDSRMITDNGVLAFQSAQAPLSNLFPCEIKNNGQIFSSVEQAYHYRRAIHHRQYNTAQLILYQDDPYDIMAQMKDFKDDHEWLTKRMSIMEELVRCKAEQVDIFKDLLKSSGNLSLVENTWNGYWGSGCPWLAGAVWVKQFSGQNQFGQLLERIRGSI